VLERPLTLAATSADLVTLVKPQFEVGKAGIRRGGLVKSESLALQSLSDVSAWVSGDDHGVHGGARGARAGGTGMSCYKTLDVRHKIRLSRY